MTVTGTLTLDLTALGRTIVFSLDECFGSTVIIDSFTNDPASSVNSFQLTYLSCAIVTDDVIVQLAASDDLGLVSAGGVVQTPTANYPVGAEEDVTLTLSSFAVSAPLEAVDGGGQGLAGAPSGTLTATAELTKQPRITWTDELDDTTLRFVQQNLSVSGSIVVALDDGTTFTLPMNDENCYAYDFSMCAMTKP